MLPKRNKVVSFAFVNSCFKTFPMSVFDLISYCFRTQSEFDRGRLKRTLAEKTSAGIAIQKHEPVVLYESTGISVITNKKKL